jgi:hypothetical protein
MRYLAVILSAYLIGVVMGQQMGREMEERELLDPLNPTEELEMACLGMWISEQNHEAVRRGIVK